MLKDIDPYLKELNDNFKKRITIPASFRKAQLTNLQKGITEMKKDMEQAVFEDLGRTHFWTECSEIMGCIDAC